MAHTSMLSVCIFHNVLMGQVFQITLCKQDPLYSWDLSHEQFLYYSSCQIYPLHLLTSFMLSEHKRKTITTTTYKDVVPNSWCVLFSPIFQVVLNTKQYNASFTSVRSYKIIAVRKKRLASTALPVSIYQCYFSPNWCLRVERHCFFQYGVQI